MSRLQVLQERKSPRVSKEVGAYTINIWNPQDVADEGYPIDPEGLWGFAVVTTKDSTGWALIRRINSDTYVCEDATTRKDLPLQTRRILDRVLRVEQAATRVQWV